MASSKVYRDWVLEQLDALDEIECRPMMGEYLLYHRGVLFGGIYDNRLLIKKTNNNAEFNLTEAVPYNHAKPMYQVEDLENREKLSAIITITVNDLL